MAGADRILLSSGERIGPNLMAEELIESGFQGGFIRLIACRTGCPNSQGIVFGKELSSALNARVSPTVVAAPKGPLQVGSMFGPGPVVQEPRVLVGASAFNYYP